MTELTQEQRDDYANRLRLSHDIQRVIRDIQREIIHNEWSYPNGTLLQKNIEWDLGDGMAAKVRIEVALPGAKDYIRMMDRIIQYFPDEEDDE